MADPDYPSLDPEIAALLRARKKEQAVKAVREKTGLRMEEARRRIDEFEAQMGQAPGTMSATKKSLIFWIVVIAVGLTIYFAAQWLSRT